jgi:NADPH2:quinone reductase
MRAIVVREYGEPEAMKVEEAPVPEPGPGQVLVRIRAAGVNPAEAYARSGKYASRPELPYTPGTDGAGVVEAVGPGVESAKPGDRVYLARSLSGTYAEYALALESQVHPLPEKAGFPQGAGLFVPYAAAYRALFQLGRARAGETVLVHGASGGVGVAALQFASAAGLDVIGTAGSERGRELARGEGARHVLDHRAPGCRDEVMRITGGRGVDLVVEMLANENLGADIAMLARHGRVVVVGSRGEATINPRDLMSRDAAVLGMLLWNIPETDEAEVHGAIADGLARGALRPVVGAELPLESAPEAHRKLFEPGAYGKIVLLP